MARLGAQLLMQAALEAEVTEFLGRDRYQRAAACEDARPGSRNGYRDVTVKTTAGPVKLARPKLRGTTGAFASRLSGAHVTKTNALESLVIASFVRGLSVRDVEATLAEALGDQAAISKSTVSSVCQAIKGEYEAWALRRLEEITLDYLFLDASFFRMHPGSPAEPVLAAGASPPAASPPSSAWPRHRRVRRCLARLPHRPQRPGPGLPAADHLRRRARADHGHRAGLPQGLRQRCVIHRARNILAKIPAGMQAEVKDAYWKISGTADLKTAPGPRLVELIDARISEMAERYGPTYPAAMKCLTTDPDGLACVPRRRGRSRGTRSISSPARWPSTGPCGSRATPRPRKSRRVLKLPTKAVQALRQHHARRATERLAAEEMWQTHDLVFCRADGTPLDRWQVRKEFQKITRVARLGGAWTPRKLRHSFVSSCAHDVRLDDISYLVGHSSTSVTETVYLHEIRPAVTDNATAVNRILKANVTELACPCSGKAIGSPIGSRNFGRKTTLTSRDGGI